MGKFSDATTALKVEAILGVAMAFGAAAWADKPAVMVAAKVRSAWVEGARGLSPSAVELGGWLGARVEANATNRLATIDLEPLLAGFRRKPGIHPWIGEHIGKWMHAATLAWANTGSDTLKRRLDYAAAELVKAQEPDGYLGTYVSTQRFGLFPNADWDVWSHKYCLLGLLTYYQYTGNEPALDACRKAGDLLCNTFGPGKKSILSAGTHQGMAATSVLEPMVLLYRCTGEPRYLDFARYIVASWDEPGGPAILKTLTTVKQVNKTANAKAYEMLSNLVGLCELARTTGDRTLLEPVLNAWEDITSRRLYLTGSASQGEHFKDDFFLPTGQDAAVAETCVTTTWLQLNAQLLRLTGDAKFGTELEKTFYNHLAAAQDPRGGDWCYFTPLEGVKKYDSGITCCHSSGPRGMALAPQQACFILPGDGTNADTIAVNLFETFTARVPLAGGTVTVRQETGPAPASETTLRLGLARPATFAVAIRAPDWARPMRIRATGKAGADALPVMRNGWLTIPERVWKDGDQVLVELNTRLRVVEGQHGNQGKAAIAYGPFVLAWDEKLNAGQPAGSVVSPGLVANAEALPRPVGASFEVTVPLMTGQDPTPRPTVLVPFADAGASGGAYKVWLPEAAAR